MAPYLEHGNLMSSLGLTIVSRPEQATYTGMHIRRSSAGRCTSLCLSR